LEAVETELRAAALAADGKTVTEKRFKRSGMEWPLRGPTTSSASVE